MNVWKQYLITIDKNVATNQHMLYRSCECYISKTTTITLGYPIHLISYMLKKASKCKHRFPNVIEKIAKNYKKNIGKITVEGWAKENISRASNRLGTIISCIDHDQLYPKAKQINTKIKVQRITKILHSCNTRRIKLRQRP